jgi:hypothetical protein
MDGGVCGGRCLARCAMGQRAGLWWSMCALPVAVAWARAFLPETADLCATRGMGIVARPARADAWHGHGDISSVHGRACIPYFWQGRIDIRVQPVVAGMVPCCDGEAETRVNNEN